MRHITTTAAAIAIVFVSFSSFSASAKTVKECDAEYSANKDAIKGAGQKKKDFVTACRAGTETIPSTAASAPTSTQPATPAPAPTPASVSPSRPHPTIAATPTSTNEFTSDTQASSRCPGQTVVWVNTHSHIYHFAGHRDYGNTKSGAYMCEADATASGNRAPLNEKHP